MVGKTCRMQEGFLDLNLRCLKKGPKKYSLKWFGDESHGRIRKKVTEKENNVKVSKWLGKGWMDGYVCPVC